MGIVITLIVFNVIIDIADKFEDDDVPVEYDTEQIKEHFFSELNNFGISEDWIKQKRIWQNAPDSIKYFYKVSVPVELTIPEIILSVRKRFSEFENVKIECEEFKINSTSQIQILSNEHIKFRVQFDYDEKIKRIRPNISFVVGSINDLSDLELKELLEISYPCALMLVPSSRSKQLIESLSNYDKDFVILINDDLSDELFELDAGATKSKIRRSINNITNEFSETSKYFVDQDSDIFKSVMFNYIKDEFGKKKIVLYRLSTLKNVSIKTDAEKMSFLQYHFNDVESKEGKIFYITAEDYISLQPYIEKFKKMGNKFVPLSEN